MEFSSNTMEVLNLLFEKFGIAINWANDNIIPYMQGLIARIIKYEIATSVLYIVLCLSITFALLRVVKFCYKKSEHDDFFEGACIGCSIFLVIACIVSTVVVFMMIAKIIACLTVPEKIIFDMVSGMTG